MTTSEYIDVFNSYRMYIFYFCKKFLGHQQDAEDITSFVFLRLWENREKVIARSAKAFLLVTANHKCQDYFKNKNRYTEVVNTISLNDLDEIEIENNVLEYVYRLIESFNPQEKRMILMKYKEGKEVKEISKLLGLTPQTVSNTLNNGLKRLRAIIKRPDKSTGPVSKTNCNYSESANL